MKELIKKLIPCFLLDFYHYLLAVMGNFLYGQPSKKIKVIGITGTSGKTTVVNLAAKILEEAGYKVASLSSIKFKIGNKEWENKLKMTMPGRFKIQKFLRQALRAGCQYLVLEVTSEGIKQFRHKFIDFDVVVFTNLSPEHIEVHKGFENYKKAKLELFKNAKNIHIVNLDDENARYFLGCPAEKKYGFRIKNPSGPIGQKGRRQELRIKNIKVIEAREVNLKENYSSFVIHNSLFKIHLLGKFNIYNALASIVVSLSQGVSLKICKKALEEIKGIPGRMEIVIDKPFRVIVDYAHTPQSLKKVYETLRISNFQFSISKKIPNSKFQKSKMICVLGACGGGRDKWKRPVLGKIAAKYCKEIIITNEDPYDENPGQILSMIKSGIFNFPSEPIAPEDRRQFSLRARGPQGPEAIFNFYEILDRRKAIRKALELAKPDDIVIITGKGSEPWMCVKRGKKIAWDDRKVVREEFRKIANKREYTTNFANSYS